MENNSLFGPYLVEIAWEVSNKVGGIYTVIQSKVPYMRKHWGDQYCLIGPILGDTLPVEFQPVNDYSDPYGQLVLQLRKEGYEVEYGDWLINGKPRVILLPLQQVADNLNNVKYDYYNHYGISFTDDPLINQVTSFAFLTSQVMRKMNEMEAFNRPIIAHFHEWMASMPILDIKRLGYKISTVFTTHATSLGRYMAMNDLTFYKRLHSIDWRAATQRFGIETQVLIERLSAKNTDVMSTVSRVTDNECKYLLGRESDVILPNGYNTLRDIAMHEFQNMHLAFKEKIHEFVMGHFFNNYTFNLDNTLYFFTSGRYEYVNKGYDITLEALRRLNVRMKKAEIDKTVVMFFVTKRPTQSINPIALQLRSFMEEIKQTCDAIQEEVRKKLFYYAATQTEYNLPELNQFVDEYWQFRYKKTIQSWKTTHWPLVVTHNLTNDAQDEILGFIRQAGLFNKPEDPVKIIYHPDFIDSTNPLFKMDYPQFVRGCHLGIFPSYYEPWGYTPVECVVRGIPTVTSDLAGFGDFVKQNMKSQDENGIYVIRRRNQTFDEAAEELTDYLFDFVRLNRRERIMQRNSVESTADMFSWDNLGRHYLDAYKLALEKAKV